MRWSRSAVVDCPVVDGAEKAEEEGEGEGGVGKCVEAEFGRNGIAVFYLTEIRGIGVEKRWSQHGM